MSEYKLQVQRFRDYLTTQLEKPDSEECSLETLFEMWRHENPSQNLFQENVQAIQLAIDEIEKDTGVSIAELDRKVREKYPTLRQA